MPHLPSLITVQLGYLSLFGSAIQAISYIKTKSLVYFFVSYLKCVKKPPKNPHKQLEPNTTNQTNMVRRKEE